MNEPTANPGHPGPPPALPPALQAGIAGALGDGARSALATALQPAAFAPGECFIRQGADGDCLFLLESGQCEVRVEGDDGSFPVATLGPGDIVGEMALLTGEPRSASVVAMSPVAARRLDRDRFATLSEAFPEVRELLTQVVTHRFERATRTAERAVGKYLITGILGRGGWSVVYHGRHTTLDMPVAIKMLKHTLAMNPGFIEQFQNEARIIAALNHQNIVKVYDVERLFRTVFIIMEQMQGQTLEQAVAGGAAIPAARAARILAQIADGLRHAHGHGVVHRDVKPANIFLETGDHAKILDFGLACRSGAVGGRIVGTPQYMAPEQLRGAAADHRSDIYALGLCAYRLVTGRDAFPGEDTAALIRMQLGQEPPDPRNLAPDLPAGLAAFIRRATRKAPAERWQDLGEVMPMLLDSTSAQPLAGPLATYTLSLPAACPDCAEILEDFRHAVEALGGSLRPAP
jgi:eukaryotic-like serine/threonine-protein kinase